MYHNKLVVGIYAGSKKLAEDGQNVFVPFGTEYEIHLKNVSPRRMAVQVDIDGKDVMEGKQLLLEPNKLVKLKRFYEGSAKEGSAFKFIQMTDKIAGHRGERIDDSMIRISYWMEKEKRERYYTVFKYVDPFPFWWGGGVWIGERRSIQWGAGPNNVQQSLTNGNNFDSGSSSAFFCSARNAAPTAGAQAKLQHEIIPMEVEPDKGITVPGSDVKQEFTDAYIGELEATGSVMILHLVGQVGEEKVERPVLESTVLVCETCGFKSNPQAKFCPECGTKLKRFTVGVRMAD